MPVEYLKKYRTSSELLKPISLGALGDAYCQLKDYDEAIKYYLKSARCKKNTFTSPFFYMKAAQTYEFIKEYEKALKLYQKIKKDYPKSQQAGNIDKYIGRIDALIGNQ